MELTKNTSVDPAKMIGKNYIEAVNAKFPNTILDEEWSTPNQVTLTIKTNMLPDVVEYLYYQHEGWLPLGFGNDERSIHGNYAVYYVLSMEGEVKTFITIKALVDPVSLEFPSVTPKVKAAVWGERELFDMYGLKAVGLPDQRRLVLPDDWPDDLYPLIPWTTVYVPIQQRQQKHTNLLTKKAKHVSFHLARYILLPMNQDTSVCSWMGKISLMRTIVCSMCTALWKNWQKLVWITTKLTSWLTVCAGFVVLPTVWPTLIPSKVL